MLLNFLLLLILIVLFLILWSIIRKRGSAQVDPDEEPLPNFPIPRPVSDYIDPPREEVKIGVERDGGGAPAKIVLSNPNLVLVPEKQAAWSSSDGKVEIRFRPNASPFSGSVFVSAKGGTALSGKPRIEAVLSGTQSYIVLLTTADGYLLRDEAQLTVVRDQKDRGY